ncbi:MAG: MMPL family transporter, partial [Chitinivibrionales bacterium]|nr:MMPL family transporter [Chitinivibrionales bacterium]MBD3394449.1 MMPL family transporter [Chitinivibrionales bacterium]
MIERIIGLVSRHRPAAMIALGFAGIAAVFVLSRRRFSSDILDLLPLEDKVIARQYEFLSASGAMQQVVLDISSPDTSAAFAGLSAAAGLVVDTLAASGLFDMSGPASPEEFMALRNLLLENWPNLFARADSAWVASRLNADTLSRRLDRRLASLFTFSDMAADGFAMRHDPFGLAAFGLRRLAALKPVEDVFFEDGFITNEDRSRILILVRIAGSGMDERTARATGTVFDKLEKMLRARGLRMVWMGAVRASRDNVDTVKRDVHFTAPIAAALILGICFLIYRRFYYGFLALVPTIAGILLTLALFSLAARVSIIMVGFGAALLGITIDYAVHYLYHLDAVPEDRRPAATLAPPILASALTTAGAFAVLVVAGIPGLSQLGLVTAGGILIVAFLSIVALPAFVTPAAPGTGRRRAL